MWLAVLIFKTLAPLSKHALEHVIFQVSVNGCSLKKYWKVLELLQRHFLGLVSIRIGMQSRNIYDKVLQKVFTILSLSLTDESASIPQLNTKASKNRLHCKYKSSKSVDVHAEDDG